MPDQITKPKQERTTTSVAIEFVLKSYCCANRRSMSGLIHERCVYVLSSVHAIQKKLPQALPVASHQVLQTDMCVCVHMLNRKRTWQIHAAQWPLRPREYWLVTRWLFNSRCVDEKVDRRQELFVLWRTGPVARYECVNIWALGGTSSLPLFTLHTEIML